MNPATNDSSDNAAGANIASAPTHSSSGPSAPKPGPFRKNVLFYSVAGILVLGTGLLAAAMIVPGMGMRQPFTGPTWTAKKEKMLVTIVERGSLESAENNDIIVRVKAGIRGSANASTIKWVVDDGTLVKIGDKLVELDDSGFQDQLKTQRNTVASKYADWVGANNDTGIQEKANVSDIKTAEVNLIQMELELKKYAGELAGTKLARLATQEEIRKYLQKQFEEDIRAESAQAAGKYTSAYQQSVSGLEGAIELAKSDKESWLDRAAWSQRMVKRGFYSLSQADADQSRLQSMEIAFRKAQGDLDIYRIFDCEKNVTKTWSDVKEAERNLKRKEFEAEANLKKKRADETAKKSIYDQEVDRLRDMERDEKFYVMTAPQDGLVVYFVPEQAKSFSGSQQATVAQGEPVRESQKLMRIPNLHKMLVNTRVHEAMVSKVKGEIVKTTHYGDTLRTTFSLGRTDMFALASYFRAFEEARENFKDKEQNVVYSGQDAKIRVDAFPGRSYAGHVKTVATVASQADFLSSDVKVYQTMVSIEDISEERLKPGMSAEVTILADQTKDEVLVIPIQAVVGNVTMGANRKCYVLDEKGHPHEKDIVVGKSNDKLVEITSGIQEGDKVVLNPRPLIPEKSDMKPGTPTTRRGAEFEEGGGKKAKKADSGAKKK